MPLNYPKLALPDAPETLAFRVVERVLKTDPVLHRVVRDWNSWTGAADDVLPVCFAQCPSITLAPTAMPSAWEAEGMHRMPMSVGIQAAVAGSNVDQLMNFWHAIRTALWPEDPDRFAHVRRTIQDAHITRPQMSMSGYGADLDDKGYRLLIAAGKLDLILLINTP